MNETPPPPPSGAQHPHDGHTAGDQHQQSSTGGLDQFFAWIRGLGIVRGNDRWFAGVAGGIAAKAGIDPLIVRGIFVVLAVLGGPGVLLYLIAWLLLPDFTGRIHAQEVLRGRASTGVIVAAVILGALLVLPLLLGMLPGIVIAPFGNAFGLLPDWLTLTLGIIWWALIVPGLIVWLAIWISGRRSNPGPIPPNDPPTPSAEGWEAKGEEWGRRAEAQSERLEQWANDHHEAHTLGAAQLLITLALALIVSGGIAAWGLSLPVSLEHALTAALIAAVSVLGVSMIIAGARGKYSGWVGFLAFIGVVALVIAPFSREIPERTDFVPFGNTSVGVDETGQNQGFVTIAGNTTIDLSKLDDTGSQPAQIDVWMLAGNVTVVLPDVHPTRLHLHVLAGNVRDQRLDADDRRQGGIFMSRSIESNTAGADPSEITHLTVRLLAGNVYVEGGGDRALTRSEARERELLEAEARASAEAEAEAEAEQQRQDEIEQLRERLEELESAR